jgi:hypothetical protein
VARFTSDCEINVVPKPALHILLSPSLRRVPYFNAEACMLSSPSCFCSVHSAMLHAMMKAVDHSLLIEDDGLGDFTQPALRRQKVW